MTCTTGGRAEAVRVVMRDGGGAAVAPGNGLSPVPYNRVMVQGLVVRFIVSGLDEVGGGGGVGSGRGRRGGRISGGFPAGSRATHGVLG
jgi:hypothetical protein